MKLKERKYDSKSVHFYEITVTVAHICHIFLIKLHRCIVPTMNFVAAH